MSIISVSASYLLKLSQVSGIGQAYLRILSEVPFFYEYNFKELASVLSKFNNNSYKQIASKLLNVNEQQLKKIDDFIARQVAMMEQHNVDLICNQDESYPKLLKESSDDPAFVFVKGTLPNLSMRKVAVIGTREPTSHGKIICERITKWLVEHDTSIVSGLALGCDSIAHRTAVNYGGHTTAILANGLDMIYPKENIGLAQDILESGGCLLSNYPIGTEVDAYKLVKRDAIQAAMSEGVVMVQSSKNGGSLHASNASVKNNRWLAVPYPTIKDLKDSSLCSNSDSKIEANLILASQDEDKIMELLLRRKTKKKYDNLLDNIKILEGRDDYQKLLQDNTLTNKAKLKQNCLF